MEIKLYKKTINFSETLIIYKNLIYKSLFIKFRK